MLFKTINLFQRLGEKLVVKNNILNVIDDNYCIGCGICSAHSSSFTIKEVEGKPKAFYEDKIDNDIDDVCPFATNINENEIAESIFSNKGMLKSNRIGYYSKIYSGYVNDRDQRLKSSSGGIATWLLVQLMNEKIIDGVIHVGPSEKNKSLFKYKISKSISEIKTNTKSHYYPCDMKDVLTEVKASKKKYAVVGVPCYLKGLRLLSRKDENVKRNLLFYFGIFCGHMKTKYYADLIGWQMGINSSNLKKIDFRVKNDKSVNDYSVEVFGKDSSIKERTSNLIGTDWGEGLFKPKACEWCDDIAGETADISFGDAWLDKYKSDSDGRNIIIVRNALLNQMLEKGNNLNEIELAEESIDDVYESQAGNFRHRREGLQHRRDIAVARKVWFPKKRYFINSSSISYRRKLIYEMRYKLSMKSHKYFLKAKQKNNLNFFILKMLPLQIKYYIINGRLIKFSIKYILKIIKYVLRKKEK